MNVFKHTLKCAFIYCLSFIAFANLSSCMRGANPVIDVCSNGGWCSNVMYLDGTNNHLLITINLDDENLPLISQEEALERLEEAFGFIELSIISNLESEAYPATGDE